MKKFDETGGTVDTQWHFETGGTHNYTLRQVVHTTFYQNEDDPDTEYTSRADCQRFEVLDICQENDQVQELQCH